MLSHHRSFVKMADSPVVFRADLLNACFNNIWSYVTLINQITVGYDITDICNSYITFPLQQWQFVSQDGRRPGVFAAFFSKTCSTLLGEKRKRRVKLVTMLCYCCARRENERVPYLKLPNSFDEVSTSALLIIVEVIWQHCWPYWLSGVRLGYVKNWNLNLWTGPYPLWQSLCFTFTIKTVLRTTGSCKPLVWTCKRM